MVSRGTSLSPAVCAAAAILALVGCAQTSQVEKTFEDPAFSDASFTKFMVIGAAESDNVRRMFEEQLVASLRERGVDAIPSYAHLGRGTAVTRESVVAACKTQDVDAVLVTRLKSSETQTRIEESREEVKVTRKDEGAFNLFRYDYDVLTAPEVVKVTTTVVLSTDLYTVAGRAKIWSVDSTAFETETVREAIEAESGAIVGQLSRDGYLAR
ncbi:MAG: hypothetical protein AAFZ58_08530 [Pseudomonadota bacterium]